jgi:hypothetical protein
MKFNPIHIIILTIVTSIIGCGEKKGAVEVPSNPTFAQHIAPIMAKNCLPCHRLNGAAPFSLEQFSAVRKRAKTIAKVTLNRYMPPWPADPNYSHFVGEKVLTDLQIATIQRWVEQGAPEGGSNYTYRAPELYRSSIRKPDLVIPFDTVVLHEGDLDRFFISKAQVKLDRKRYVSALELVPASMGLIHHANGHLLLYAEGTKSGGQGTVGKIETTKGVNLKSFERLNLISDDGSVPVRVHSAFNYLPGVEGVEYPSGIGGYEVPRDFAAVMNDVHYGPAYANTTDKPVLNVFFTDVAPKRATGELMLGTNGVSKIVPPLVVPSNKVTKHTTRYTIDADISVLTINPHLHQLGKSFWAFAIKPNGDTIPLIRIKRWNVNWQYFYTFKTMVKIPAGSEIVAIAEFDNTTANPYNPNQPPKTVAERWDYGGASMRASDEMFQFILTYTPYQKGDENISLERKIVKP